MKENMGGLYRESQIGTSENEEKENIIENGGDEVNEIMIDCLGSGCEFKLMDYEELERSEEEEMNKKMRKEKYVGENKDNVIFFCFFTFIILFFFRINE
ncbi:MAG: hypothetical protein Ta2E_11160 [Mycoplasmoidaceae bacterium]|nr:MAG: hypothetical protein Ta2E_11160 [Mycoplasmoidaceae bacterium]